MKIKKEKENIENEENEIKKERKKKEKKIKKEKNHRADKGRIFVKVIAGILAILMVASIATTLIFALI